MGKIVIFLTLACCLLQQSTVLTQCVDGGLGGYSGTFYDCECFCSETGRQKGQSGSCSYFPSGEFSSGGCSFCPNGQPYPSSGFLASYTLQITMAMSDDDCQNQCKGYAQNNFIPPTSYTFSYFPMGSFTSDNNCSCTGNVNPCNHQGMWTAKKVLDMILRK